MSRRAITVIVGDNVSVKRLIGEPLSFQDTPTRVGLLMSLIRVSVKGRQIRL